MTGTQPESSVPVGLATKLGAIVAAALAVLAALAEFGVELDSDTQDLLTKALVAIGIVLGGRYAQATAGKVAEVKADPSTADVRTDAAFQRGLEAGKEQARGEAPGLRRPVRDKPQA